MGGGRGEGSPLVISQKSNDPLQEPGGGRGGGGYFHRILSKTASTRGRLCCVQ